MQIQLPPLAPVHVTFVTTEPLFYTQWDFWLSVGTLLLAGITGWLALETRKMRQGSDKAIGELSTHAASAALASVASSEAAKASAEALQSQAQDTKLALEIAKRNADSAERLAEANEALAISGHRGWLVPVKTSVGGSHHPDQGFTVTGAIHFRNVGPTPCVGIGIRHCISFLESQPKDFSEGCDHTDHPVVAPGEEITVPFKRTFSNAEFLQLTSESKRFYIYGNLHYKNVFGYYCGTYWRYEYRYGHDAESGHGIFPCDAGNKVE